MKTYLSYSTLVILISICFYTCTKKENKTGSPLSPIAYNGIFSSSIYSVGNGTTLITYFTSEIAQIYTTTPNQSTFNVTNLVDAGTVSLNGVTFVKEGIYNIYTDTSKGNPFTPPYVWSITGSTTIPAFTFTNTNTYPIFDGYKSIPDSFQTSTGLVIPLADYSNVDEIEVHFITSNGKVTESKFFPGNTDTIRFSASEFYPVTPIFYVTLYLNFIKNNKQVINGNNYNFPTGYHLRKEGIKYN